MGSSKEPVVPWSVGHVHYKGTHGRGLLTSGSSGSKGKEEAKAPVTSALTRVFGAHFRLDYSTTD